MPGDNAETLCDGLTLTLRLIQTQLRGQAILRQQFAMQGPKCDPDMFFQNVKGGHTCPLPVRAFLDWPNGRPAVRHSPHQIQLTHCELSVDKLTLHTVDQYLCLPSETHPVKLFKLAVFKQLQ